jgi:hypothetical protein
MVDKILFIVSGAPFCGRKPGSQGQEASKAKLTQPEKPISAKG